MSIEMEIPKDIMKYKSKLIGPFTARQCLALIPASLLGLGAYNILKSFSVSSDTMIPIIMIVTLPFLAFGWVSIQGLPLEKFIKVAFISAFISPTKRLYKSKNYYRSASVNFEQISQNKKKKKRKKSTLTLYQ